MLLSLTLITTNLFRYWSQVSSLWVTSELLLYFSRMFSWMLIISWNAISILLGKVVLITELHIVVVCCPGQFTLIGEGTPHWFGALSFLSFIIVIMYLEKNTHFWLAENWCIFHVTWGKITNSARCFFRAN